MLSKYVYLGFNVRIIRDIPLEYIKGNKYSNLRRIMDELEKKENIQTTYEVEKWT